MRTLWRGGPTVRADNCVSFSVWQLCGGLDRGYASVLHIDCTRWGLTSVVLFVRETATWLSCASAGREGQFHGVAVWHALKFWSAVAFDWTHL